MISACIWNRAENASVHQMGRHILIGFICHGSSCVDP